MIDFKLILTLVSIGLLLLVAIFALLGFFAGLKKELKCTAIALVLLLLTFIVFGNPGWILNMNGEFIKSFLGGIPSSAHTVWECILGYVQSMVENGAEIFVEGSKSYAFLYNLVSGLARGLALIVGTLVMLIIILLVNGIFRLISRIRQNKKAKKAANCESAEAEEEEQPSGKTLSDTVLVLNSSNAKGNVVVSTNKNETKVVDPKRRAWGAVLAGVRAIVVIIILFMPIAGISSVLDNITPETEAMLHEIVGGSTTKTASNPDAVDYAMDFNEAYNASAIGKFVNGSQYFFKDSLSVKLFDKAFVMESDDMGKYPIRPEFNNIIAAVNALEGNAYKNGKFSLDNLTHEELVNALEALKDSNLIPDVIPVGIEVAYYSKLVDDETLSDMLFKSGQQAAFLDLRNADWDKEIDNLLDVVEDAVNLGVLDKDFDPIAMGQPELVRSMLDKLGSSETLESLLDVAVLTALNNSKVTDILGPIDPIPNMEEVSWKETLSTLADMYERFQDLPIESMDDVKGDKMNDTIANILNNPEDFDTVADIVKMLVSLDLVNELAPQIAINKLTESAMIKDAGTDVVEAVEKLAEADWEKDINTYLEAVKEGLSLVDSWDGLTPNVDVFSLDPETLQNVIDKLFETETFEQLLPIATNLALNTEAYKDLIGNYSVEIDTSDINWQEDLNKVVSIYGDFLDLGITEAPKGEEVLDLLSDILSDETKTQALENILDELADLTLFEKVAMPVANAVLNNKLTEAVPEFADILDLNDLTVEEWKEDFNAVVDTLKAVNEVCGYDLSLENLDAEDKDAAISAIDNILNLNVLSDDAAKSALVEAALKKFDVLPEEELEKIDLSNVNWDTEIAAIEGIVGQAFDILGYEALDITSIGETDWNELLENDQFIDDVIDILDSATDSEVILELAHPLINKFVNEIIAKQDPDSQDDYQALKEIIDDLSSEELINEVCKLADTVKAVIDLGILNIADGIEAIDLKNTEAMHQIVDGIFDSKLLEGNESKVIRIILKLTKVFDLEKDFFDGIDYDTEQEILNKVIDELAVVANSDYYYFEDGKAHIDSAIFKDDNMSEALFKAIESLIGSWSIEDGYKAGSEIFERILPQAYNKFAADKIPEEFAGLVNGVFKYDEADGATLAYDLAHVIYIGRQAVKVDALLYLADGDVDFSYDNQSFLKINSAINGVVEAIADMNAVKGNESFLFAWVINYAIDKLNVPVDHVSAGDYAETDWVNEKETFKALAKDVLDILNANDLASVGDIARLINRFNEEGKDIANEFITQENAELAIQLLEDAANLDIIRPVAFIGVAYAIDKFADKIDLGFIYDDITKNNIMEDVNDLVEIAKILVNDCDIVGIYNSKLDHELPAEDAVIEVIDRLFHLHMLEGNLNELVEVLVTKFLPENEYIAASDFDFNNFDPENEITMIKDLISVLYPTFEDINIHTIQGAINLVKNGDYKYVKITDELIADIGYALVALSSSDLIPQAVRHFADKYLTSSLYKTWGDFSVLAEVDSEAIKNDLVLIGGEIVIFTMLEPAEFINEFVINGNKEADLAIDDTFVISLLIGLIGQSEIINNYGSEFMPSVLNKLVSRFDIIKSDYEYTSEDFDGIVWEEEFITLSTAVTLSVDLLNRHNVDSYQDIMTFVKNQGYMDPSFLDESTANRVIDILDVALDSVILQNILVVGFDTAVQMAVDNGIDISFVKGELSKQQILEDVKTLLAIGRDLVEFGAVDYVVSGDVEHFQSAPIVDAIDLFSQLNIFAVDRGAWIALGVEFANKVIEPKGFSLYTTKGLYSEDKIDYDREFELLKDIAENAIEALLNENIYNLVALNDFITNKYYQDINAYNANVIENVENIIRDVVNMQIVQANILNLYYQGLQFVAPKLGEDVDLSDFYAGPNGILATDFADDIDKVIDAANLLIAFGAIEYVIQGDIESIDVEYLADALEIVKDCKIINKLDNSLFAFAYNIAAAKFDLDGKDNSEFNDCTASHEIQVLANVVRDLGDVLNAQNVHSYSGIMDLVNDKAYQKTYLYTDETIDALLAVINDFADLNMMKIILPEALEYGVKLADEKAKLDVSFLLDKNFTGEELASDVKNLLPIVREICNFPLVEILSTKGLENINVVPVINALGMIQELNIVNRCNADFAAFGYNYLADFVDANMHITLDKVEASDFANVDFDHESAVLADVVRAAYYVLYKLDLISTDDVISFVKDKEFSDYKVYNDEAAKAVVNAIRTLADLESLQVVVTDLVDLGLTYVPSQFDLSFIKPSSFTPAELCDDIKTLCDIADILVDFGAVAVLRNENVKLDLQYVAEVLPLVQSMNIVSKYDADFAAFGYKYLTDMLGKQLNYVFERHNANDFATIDFDHENAVLVDAVLAISEVQEALGLEYAEDLMNFINNKDFLATANYNNEAAKAMVNVVRTLVDLDSFGLVLPDFINFGLKKVPQGLDVSFIKTSDFTTDELCEDIKTICDMADIIIDFGALSIVNKENVAIDLQYIADLIPLLEQYNVLVKYNANVAAFIYDFVNRAANFHAPKKTALSFSVIDYAHENALAVQLVEDLAVLAEAEGLRYYEDYEALIKGGYKSTYLYNYEASAAVQQLVKDFTKSEIFNLVLDILFKCGIKNLGPAVNVDLQFLIDADFTSEEIIADIIKLLPVMDHALDFGIVELLSEGKLSEIDAGPIIRSLELVFDTNIVNTCAAEIVTAGLNYAFKQAKLDVHKLYPYEFDGVVWDEEFDLFIDIIRDANYVGYCLDILSTDNIQNFINDKKYNDNGIYTDKLGHAVAILIGDVSYSQVVSVIVKDLLQIGLKTELPEDIDLSVINPYVFTNNEIMSDLFVIASALDSLVNAGVLEYVRTNDIEHFELDYVANAVYALGCSNILNEYADELLSQGVNAALNHINLDITRPTPATYANVNWFDECDLLVDVILAARNIYSELGFDKLSDVRYFIEDKEYENYSNYTKSVIQEAASIFEYLSKSEIIKAHIVDIFNMVIDKLPDKYDFSPLKVDNSYADILMEDLGSLAVIGEHASYIKSVMAGNDINYNDYDMVNDAIDLVFGSGYVNGKLADILKVVSEVTDMPFDQYINASEVDLAADAELLKNAYYNAIDILMSKYNPVKSINDTVINVSQLKKIAVEYATEISAVMCDLAQLSFAPGAVKTAVVKFEDKLPAKVQDILAIVDIPNMDNQELQEDLIDLSVIYNYASGLNAQEYFLFSDKHLDLSAEGSAAVVTYTALHLNVVENNYVDLIDYFLADRNWAHYDKANIAVSDWDTEVDNIVNIVCDALDLFDVVGITNESEIKPYFEDLLNNIKSSMTALTDEIVTIISVESGRDALYDIASKTLSLDLVASLGLSAYINEVLPKVPSEFVIAAELEEFPQDAFARDLERLSQIVNFIKEAKVDKLLTMVIPQPETAVVPLQQAVRTFAALEILDYKLERFGPILSELDDQFGINNMVSSVLGTEIDFMAYDYTEISFAEDDFLYAMMVASIYDFVMEEIYYGLDLPLLGNTKAMQDLIDTYKYFSKTTLAMFLVDNGIELVNPSISNLLNDNAEEVLPATVEFLNGLMGLGFFSNEGIDLNNASSINSMVAAAKKVVNIPTGYNALLNSLDDYGHKVGFIPFTWKHLTIAKEYKALMPVVQDAMSLVNNYLSDIQSGSLEFVKEATFRTDVENVIYGALNSGIVDQLFMPVVKGAYNIATSPVNGHFACDPEMNANEFVDDILPAVWGLVDGVYDLTHFSTDVDFLEFNAYVEIIDAILSSQLVLDNIGDGIHYALSNIVGFNFDSQKNEQFDSINWTTELGYVRDAVVALKDTHDATNFTLDLSGLKNSAVIDGFACALDALSNTELYSMFLRDIAKFINEKVIAAKVPALGDVLTERLNDFDYVDNYFYNDSLVVIDMIHHSASANVVDSIRTLPNWDFDEVETCRAMFFELEFVNGYEERIIKAVIDKVPMISDYYDDSMVIVDWDVETAYVVAALRGLVNDGITNLDSIGDDIIDTISGSTMTSIVNSDILVKIVVESFNDALSDAEIEYVVTTEKLRSISDWDIELDAFNQLIDLMDIDDPTTSQIIDAYDAACLTVLCNEILSAASKTILPSATMYSDYYNELGTAETSTWTIADYRHEFDVVIAEFKLFDAAGLDVSLDIDLEDLTGDIISTALESKALAYGITKEFNTKFADADINYLVTEAKLNSITTWDDELSAMSKLLDVSSTASPAKADIIDAYDAACLTVLCNEILTAAARTILPSAEMYSDYYNELGSAETDTWTDADYRHEFDVVIAEFKLFDEAGLDSSLNAPLDQLNGEILATAMSSKALALGVTEELNANISTKFSGVSVTLTSASLAAIGDADAWDAELDAVDELAEQVEKLAALEITPDQFNTYLSGVTTVIAGSIASELVIG